ncbi:WD40 repeat domain-containing protein, partial [Mycolicibacterium nivoides]
DGTRVASGGDDGTVRVWDVRTWSQVGSPLIHPGSVNTVAFSPDGTRVASGGQDGTVRVWDVRTWSQVGSPLIHPGSVNSVAFSA